MARSGKLYRLEGIVLSRRDHGEADRVVKLLTAEGSVDLLAKGIRKPRSRKAGHLELFAKTQVLVSRVTGSWDIVSQAEAVQVRSRLQEDFRLGTYARYVAELAIRLFEGETDPQLYILVDDVFSRLNGDAAPALLTRWYEQQVLALAGFRPECGMCVGERGDDLCHTPLRPRADDQRPYGLDMERGGVVCCECFASDTREHTVRPLSPSALSWLQALQRRSFDDVTQFALPERTAKELAQAMEQYIAYHLERRPAALRMFHDNRG
ncbi:MAG TPA: DNA repair protein RecO [Anaerolineae bacterium]|nr:DNA repair protein RecO [Anaerolineae bacterium]HQI85577.1 DNA repair protein RecO [Anaerolineae bacterium]